jgi:hypothetical protein
MARSIKQLKFRGKQSETLEPIEFEGYQIKSLRHGVTGHVLYCYPSQEYDWEPCWGLDLETAKKSVLRYKETLQLQSET